MTHGADVNAKDLREISQSPMRQGMDSDKRR